MKKLLPWLSVGIGSFLVFGVAPGCGSDEIAGGGSGGAATTGAGGSGTTGGSSGRTGGAASGGAGVTGGGSNASTMLGARCADNAACGPGLICLTSDSGALDGGGPAGGLCTADCTADAGLCQRISAVGRCIGTTQQAFCYEACLPGDPAVGEVKCHNRDEMACTVIDPASMAAVCLPQCNGLAIECRPGTSCDFASSLSSMGLCRAQPPQGLPTGAKCDPKAATDPCRGFCRNLNDVIGVCADGCTFGAVDACNVGGATAIQGFCSPYAGSGIGDAGRCVKFCDCTADCDNPDMKCFSFSPQAQALAGRKGLCEIQRPTDDAATTASIIDTCGAGGAAGAPNSGGATNTGGAAGAASGGGGAGGVN